MLLKPPLIFILLAITILSCNVEKQDIHRNTLPITDSIAILDEEDEAVFLQIAGEWELSEFLGTAVQPHIDPYVEGYEPTTKDIEEHNTKYLEKRVLIDKDTVISIYPGCELGYYGNNINEVAFVYKPPRTVSLKYPVLYVDVAHKDFEKSNYVFLDVNSKAYIDIDSYFYELKKVK